MKKLILLLSIPFCANAQYQQSQTTENISISSFKVHFDSFVYINLNGEYYRIKLNSEYPVYVENLKTGDINYYSNIKNSFDNNFFHIRNGQGSIILKDTFYTKPNKKSKKK